MDMNPQQAKDIIENNKPGDGSSVITTATSAGDIISGAVGDAASSVWGAVADYLTKGSGNSLADQLAAAGLSPDQIAAVLGTGGGGAYYGSGSGGGYSTPSQAELNKQAYEQELRNTYFRLWGKYAPENVITKAANEGLNVFQFEDQIRQDPSFKHSETYQNEMADNALGLARMLGIMPG